MLGVAAAGVYPQDVLRNVQQFFGPLSVALETGVIERDNEESRNLLVLNNLSVDDLVGSSLCIFDNDRMLIVKNNRILAKDPGLEILARQPGIIVRDRMIMSRIYLDSARDIEGVLNTLRSIPADY